MPTPAPESDPLPSDPMPGLPCWVAFSVPDPEPVQDKEPPDPRRGRRAALLLLCLLFGFLLCVCLGWAAASTGSTVPLWVLIAHLPYAIVFYGTRRYVSGKLKNLDDKPRLKLGTTQVLAYQPAHARAGGLYRDEERHWEWSAFTGVEFVGEGGGWYAVRLHEKPVEPSAAPARPRTPRIVRLRNLIVFFGWRKSSFALALLVPPFATLLLAALTFRYYGWGVETAFIASVLALHLLCIGFIVRSSRKARQQTPASDPDDCLYLLFDSRIVAAQEAMSRLSRYVAEQAGTDSAP